MLELAEDTTDSSIIIKISQKKMMHALHWRLNLPKPAEKKSKEEKEEDFYCRQLLLFYLDDENYFSHGFSNLRSSIIYDADFLYFNNH